MIGKTLLRVNIIGQAFLAAVALFFFIFEPSVGTAFLLWFILLFFLGLWQFCFGILEAVLYQNKQRKRYLAAAVAYILSLAAVVFVAVNYDYEETPYSEFLFLSYLSVGTLLFAAWYARQTYRDYYRLGVQKPQSFWDLEF